MLDATTIKEAKISAIQDDLKSGLIDVSEFGSRVLEVIRADAAAREKTEDYQRIHRQHMRATASAMQDRADNPTDSAHLASSDYDWLSRRGD